MSFLQRYTRTVTLLSDDFLCVISFRTRSSHVPGIPFCPFCPCDPFCPTDPFSPSMKKQTYKKRLYSTNLFAIHHEITLRSYWFSSLSLSCARRKNFSYKPRETFFRRSPPPLQLNNDQSLPSPTRGSQSYYYRICLSVFS